MSAFFSSFLFPLAFGLLALAPVIVIMYLLKLKRRPQMVPSTLLWRRSVQDLIANAPFQKLRNNLLLWLQLLILLLLTLALARPVMKMTGLGGQTIILMLDMSASMQTVEDDGETRMEKAKRLALEAVDDMSGTGGMFGSFGGRDEMMVIGFADTPVPLQSLTGDKALLRAAIRGAEALDTQTDLTDAGHILQEKTMITREGAIEPNPDARVILISDGGLGPTAQSLADVLNIDFTTVGSAERNIGFTSIDVRESFAGTFEYQVFTSIYNSGQDDTAAFVELDINGEVVDLKKIDLPARGYGAAVFTVGEALSGLATLRLVDHVDNFAADDMIRANVAPPTELEILLVSRGNSFLAPVLGVDPRTAVSQAQPSDSLPLEEFDIVVFDNVPSPDLPPGNYLFINSIPPEEYGFKRAGEPIKNPSIIDWSRVHPITRYTNFDRVLIGETTNLETPEDAVPLLQAAQTDLIGYLEGEATRVLVIGFDINKSYWPVDVSFPIFFSNLIDYWSRTGRGLTRPAYATGATVAMVPPRDASAATVLTPDDREISYDLEGQSTMYLTDTKKRGLYSVSFDEGTPQTIPVNIQSPLESDIQVVDELEIAGRTLQASRGEVKTRQELWPWLALAALGILFAEWAIYCKRTFM